MTICDQSRRSSEGYSCDRASLRLAEDPVAGSIDNDMMMADAARPTNTQAFHVVEMGMANRSRALGRGPLPFRRS